MPPAISALLVDPALFTAPYDAALTHGLQAAGVRVCWAGRPLRKNELEEVPSVDPIYYRGVQDTAKGRGWFWKMRKAASHVLGGFRLLRLARQGGFDIVHFQWAVLPIYDAFLMGVLTRHRPVVLTVHDLEPFNDAPTSRFQKLGFERALSAATRIIVHTQMARNKLIERGHAARKVVTIPHGPLTLTIQPETSRRPSPSGVWRVVLFGKLQPYKGVDVLLEALGRISPSDRARLSVVIAGEPLMPTEPLLARAAKLGLGEVVAFRLNRHSEAEMAELFASADAFVFPYRQIEASGVLHLVLPYGRWIVASDLGAFKELILNGRNGDCVPVSDPDALARALLASIGREPDSDLEPVVMNWEDIGLRTLAVYRDALSERAGLKANG